MDCRTISVGGASPKTPVAFLLAISLALSCTGCVTQQQSNIHDTNMSSTSFRLPVLSKNGKGKRPPKVETCIEGGHLLEKQAFSPKISPMEKEQILEKSRMAYQQALNLDPKNTKALLGLARVYNHLKDYPRAMETYQKALKENPKNGAVWSDLGLCHCRQKNFEKGIDAFRKAREAEPENRSYATTLAYSLARTGQVQESLQIFTQLHGEAQAHFKLAHVMLHLNQSEAARQHLQYALQRDPMMQPAHQMLAQLNSGYGPNGSMNNPDGLMNAGYTPNAPMNPGYGPANPGYGQNGPLANVGFQVP